MNTISDHILLPWFFLLFHKSSIGFSSFGFLHWLPAKPRDARYVELDSKMVSAKNYFQAQVGWGFGRS
jgi:hypothetical protein